MFPAKAKSVIYLFMAGAPSHLDMLDFKPKLQQYNGQLIPAGVHEGPALRLHQGRAAAAGLALQLSPRAANAARKSPSFCPTFRESPTTLRL